MSLEQSINNAASILGEHSLDYLIIIRDPKEGYIAKWTDRTWVLGAVQRLGTQLIEEDHRFAAHD